MPSDDPPVATSPHATENLSRAERKARRKAARRPLERQQRIARIERARHLESDGTATWKQQIGPLTFFNGGPKRPPVIEDVPLAAEVLRGALVLCRGSRRSKGESEARNSGAICRNDGVIVAEVAGRANHRGRALSPEVVDPARLAAARTIDETAVYLGKLTRHFGHFLLDCLARAWFLKDGGSRPHIVFHGGNDDLADLGPFAHAIFRALDIDPARIIVARKDLRFRELILPSSQYSNVVKGSPGMCVIFDHIRDRMLKTLPGDVRTPSKVYFTRRNLSPLALNGLPRSSFSNEDDAEAIFREHGFEIVSPETLPFEEQVAIAANATHVAGLAGSALHLILFNSRPGTKLIELRTKKTTNQMIINSIRGVDAFHIWCVSHRAENVTKLDIEVIERAMREIE